jgi:hypothetical protein
LLGGGVPGAIAGAAMSVAKQIPSILAGGHPLPQVALPVSPTSAQPLVPVNDGDAVKGPNTPQVYQIEGGIRLEDATCPQKKTISSRKYPTGSILILPLSDVCTHFLSHTVFRAYRSLGEDFALSEKE